MSQPDLFVVCKNCGSEVSPYVTECPYCGQRVRKRAPKIDRSDAARPTQKRRRRARKLPRLRADEIAGIAPDTRPYATFGLILVCVIAMLVYAAKPTARTWATCSCRQCRTAGTTTPGAGSSRPSCTRTSSATPSWRSCRSGIFGTLLERRFGPVPVVLTFVLPARRAPRSPPRSRRRRCSRTRRPGPCSARTARRSASCAPGSSTTGSPRAAATTARTTCSGVYIIAAVLVLLSLTTEEANIGAAVGGALAGSVIGLLLPRITRRA